MSTTRAASIDSIDKKRPSLAQRFKQSIVRGRLVRFHMSLILTAVMASGVLASKLMMMAGIRFLPVRYGLAVVCSYLVFLGMVRLWVWFIMTRASASLPDLSCLDFSGTSGNSGGAASTASDAVRFGGGDSGGAGATSSWVESSGVVSESADSASAGSGSGSFLPDFDFDLGDDGWWIVLLLAVVVVVLICAGGYLVWIAPDILPEAAWQVALAHGIHRASKDLDPAGWAMGIMRRSVVPLLVVLLAAIGLGWGAHHLCPHAVKLAEALRCGVP